jgi:hypothetical protein
MGGGGVCHRCDYGGGRSEVWSGIARAGASAARARVVPCGLRSSPGTVI